ncbi:MAG: hypothetical protein NZM12_12745, partial [Steroidobacteraceae bacterium]|nr:hypothetical protein [Steroidobacteraceae bacterium]MDW8258430.1 hypothetical protein [Gammaproteobacteria bacterium]
LWKTFSPGRYNNVASCLAFEALDLCRTAHRDRQSLRAAIALLRAESKLQLGGGESPFPVAVADRETLAQTALIAPFEFCAGTAEATIAARERWLRRAVELGDERAFSRTLESTSDKVRQLQLLQLLWTAGEGLALFGISQLLHERAQSEHAQADDSVSAYAHLLLYTKLQEFARVNELGPIRRRILRQAQLTLDDWGRTLTGSQRARRRHRGAVARVQPRSRVPNVIRRGSAALLEH